MFEDLRDSYIARVVKGRSFADVGGLWGTTSEKVSVAHTQGAAAVTMIDMQAAGNEWWQRFDDRLRELNVPPCNCIAAEISEVSDVTFDVVHCSGVLYHHPNPLAVLLDLRRMTCEYLVLTSAITQEVIANEAGEYRLPSSGVMFVPALSEAERAVVARYWKSMGAEAYGITIDVKYRPDEFAPWWWLPTATALRSMCETCGFAVEDADHTWNRNAYTLLLRVAS
ncbi:MAG: methyltransferase domain-containing protein [Phycisphaerae bacterium]|nr:methyltransferase domain-containing protein [Phycisphaerae bacterium]